jgi:hypothetical protein
MRNTGVRNPVLNSWIAFAICVAGIGGIVFGTVEMNRLGHETAASALSIGVGIVAAVIGAAMTVNFLRGVAVMRAIRSGGHEIARWTVTADQFDAFRESDRQRNALGPDYRNDYRPGKTPPEGVEVIFAPDGVLVGGSYFGLTTTGMFRFAGVQVLAGNPMSIEFGMVQTAVANTTTLRTTRSFAVLRIPIARTATAEAKQVLKHFQDVEARRIIVNPGHWRRGIRIGLGTAAVCAVVAAAGFGWAALQESAGVMPLVMAVVGAVGGLGGLVLAYAAWVMKRKQYRGAQV